MVISATVLARQKSLICKINICIGIMVLIGWGGEDHYKHHFSLEDQWGVREAFPTTGTSYLKKK